MIFTFLFIFGLAIGSFLNVLIDRLPNGKSILGRSHCDYCKKKLNALDLIPVASFIFLRGRCHYCKNKLSFQYPLIELLTGVMFMLIYNFIPPMAGQISNYIHLLAYLGLISTLVVIFFADLKYHIIPDSMQVALLIFTLLILFLGKERLLPNLISGFLVMLPILLLFLITKGRGMGFGDVKISFTIGLFFGLLLGYIVLYIAFITGAAVGILLIFFKKKKLKSQIAFGPFLVLGIVVTMFYQNHLTDLARAVLGY